VNSKDYGTGPKKIKFLHSQMSTSSARKAAAARAREAKARKRLGINLDDLEDPIAISPICPHRPRISCSESSSSTYLLYLDNMDGSVFE